MALKVTVDLIILRVWYVAVFRRQTYTRIKFHMLSSSVLLGIDVTRKLKKSFRNAFCKYITWKKIMQFSKALLVSVIAIP